MARDLIDIADALDRHGADLAAWPEPALAAKAREAALADRSFRARLERQADLEAGLAALRDMTDGEIAGSGAVARVERAVLGATPRWLDARRWALIAAALVVAAALGALADLTILAPAGEPSFEVVVLDPLVFGPTGTGSP
ncbi:MAG: hypothetical protein KDK07_05810 [Bauldia sp.]|nr:hypothetical protein [Bauldia sp.]